MPKHQIAPHERPNRMATRTRQAAPALLALLFLQILLAPLTAHYAAAQAPSTADSVQPLPTQQRSEQKSGDTITLPKPTVQKLDAPVSMTAKDSLHYSVRDGYAILYGNGELAYKHQQFKAGYIELDMNQQQLYARGLNDSTLKGDARQLPTYKENNTDYRMQEITYNFKSGKARISGVITEVTEGYLHGQVVKKMPNDEINVAQGKFTTCDLDHPHFYIQLTKAKVIPHDKILTGPAYLVIADVPTPLGIPFGFFPNTTKRSSGILLPEYGEENQRGFFIRNAGLYFGISDYVDLTLLASAYTRGSWDATISTNYAWRYKFRGSLSAVYSSITTGHQGTPTYNNSSSYRITWNHTQDPASNPNSTFQANVTFGSSGHNRYNSQTTQEFLNNQIMSSISYSHRFPGTPVSLSLSLNHSQNSRDSMVSITLPQMAINVARIYPFQKKNRAGKQKWYEKIGFAYSNNLQNSLSIKEDRLFTRQALTQMRNGMRHNASASVAFNLLKYINITPSVQYNERWYLSSTRDRWDPETSKVRTDTVRGFARAWDFSTSLGASTKIYGMFTFRPKSRIKAIRHVITPSISFSYHPDFSEPKLGMYDEVQYNDKGDTRRVSRFKNSVYGGPPQGEAGTLGFSIGNNFEMKYKKKTDTGEVDQKLKLIESLSLSSSYNFLADSLNLAPLAISAHSTLFNFLSLSANASFSPYSIDENNRLYNRWYYQETGKPMRFERFSISCSFSISQVIRGLPEGSAQITNFGYPPPGHYHYDPLIAMPYAIITYADFNSPWNLSVNYSYSLTKTGKKISQIQSLGFNGGITLPQDWNITLNSGYDFINRKLTMTSINIGKDLHCWQMSLSLIPFGTMRSFAFRINVKSGVLQDLKYSKQRHYLDNIL